MQLIVVTIKGTINLMPDNTESVKRQREYEVYSVVSLALRGIPSWLLCVFIPSPMREGSTFILGIIGIKFFQKEQKPKIKVSADAKLKYSWILSARRKG